VKQKYETIVIFDGGLSDDVIQKEINAFEEFLKANSEYERMDAWGKKKFAYTIEKKKSGVYCLFIYQCESEKNMSGKIDKLFKLNANIVRHLTCVRVIQPVVERKPRTVPLPLDADAEGDNQL
jgi:small subunit ribosomal protein S6